MPARRDDWLVGGDRRTVAAERIYDAAMQLIAREGSDALDIDRLAAQVHCSRATVYRYAGGKAEIRDAVLNRAAAGIVESVRVGVDGLTGRERVVTAILVALRQIRADPLSRLMVGSIRRPDAMTWLTDSPLPAALATDLSGLTDGDPVAAQWIVRTVLSLLHWPVEDDEHERELVRRFVGPAFDEKL